jgi:hypothetical protein
MPNWCTNKLVVESQTIEQMDKWRIALQNEKSMEPLLVFDKLLPLPEEEKENWYQWRIDNWGTKWDVATEDSEGNVTGDAPYHGDTVRYEYEFDTAWGPPIELFENIAKDFPGIQFNLAYYEPGMCFAGHFIVEDGEETTHDQYQSMADINWFVEDFFGYSVYEDEDMEEEE